VGAKSVVRQVIRSAGFDVVRKGEDDRYPRIDDGTPYVPDLVRACDQIPGMVAPRHGEALFWMAYSSPVDGDVVEVGSWQGRSTCYLAAACRDADNGRVHAIEHFKGNPGKQDKYVVGAEDLSDLKANFQQNIARLGLTDRVVLHDGRSEDVADQVRADVSAARLLFLDGEHTYPALSRDLELYADLVAPGGVIVFDDYSVEFPGVVEAVQEFLRSNTAFGQPVQTLKQLVIHRR
jgi:predicted O-methyltransferase YrrM